LLRGRQLLDSQYVSSAADAERIPDVNALLVSNGIKVYELSPAQETLEEAFLRLTKTVAAPNP